MNYCKYCQRQVHGTKKFSWAWLIFWTVFTAGFMTIPYLIWYALKPANKCPICGGKL